MLKVIGRTLIILLVAVAIGWGSSLLIQNSSQTFTRSGEHPDIGNEEGFAPGGNFPPGADEGTQDGSGERGGGFNGILGHLALFAVITVILVGITKLFAKKSPPPIQNGV
jgi:hypothetical protein